jgi:hypothetical protein
MSPLRDKRIAALETGQPAAPSLGVKRQSIITIRRLHPRSRLARRPIRRQRGWYHREPQGQFFWSECNQHLPRRE